MTERPGRRRLTAAVLFTPAAAAILAGSLAWASGNPPAVAAKQSSATPATSSTGESADDELQERIRSVEGLRKQVASLRADLKKLESAEGDSSSRRPGTSSGRGTTAPKATTKPKPTRKAAPPPVDANTGAS